MALKDYTLKAKNTPRKLNVWRAHGFCARLASFYLLGFIRDLLMVSKLQNKACFSGACIYSFNLNLVNSLQPKGAFLNPHNLYILALYIYICF